MLWKKNYLCVLFNVWLFLWSGLTSLFVGICRSEALRQKVGSFLLVLRSCCPLALSFIPSAGSVIPPSSRRVPRIDHGGLCSLQPFTSGMSSESGLITTWEWENWGTVEGNTDSSKLPEDESGFCFNHKNVFLHSHFHERCRGNTVTEILMAIKAINTNSH